MSARPLTGDDAIPDAHARALRRSCGAAPAASQTPVLMCYMYITPPIHRRAERLLLSLLDLPLRALDALHVATALDAEAATLVTYDPRLRDAAVSQGLFVAPDVFNRGSASE